MLFNVTKTEVLLLPGCPQITLHQTAFSVSITFDKRAARLPEVVSRDVRSDQDLLPTLKFLKHQNAKALLDLITELRTEAARPGSIYIMIKITYIL